MLHILLTILKIIGIIVLVLISLVILIMAAILFVPIKYCIDATYDKTDKLDFRVKITYLLHLISVKYVYKADNGIDIRIFGIKTHFLDRETKIKEKQLDKETKMFEKMSSEIKNNNSEMSEKYEALKKIDEERDRLADAKFKDLQGENADNTNLNKNISIGKETSIQPKDIDDEKNSEEYNDNCTNKVEKKNIFTIIYSKLKATINKIKYRFIKFCDTIKKICKNIYDFKEFISDENTKAALNSIKEEAFVVLKHVKPKKIKGYLHFGFDDPSYTGKALGLIYMILKGSPKDFNINPDFENKVLDTEIHAKGRIQCYLLLIVGIRLYKNDNLKLLSERRRTNGRE